MTDPFVGSLTFARIYSGMIEAGTDVLNTTKDKRERIGRMLLMHANNREEIKEALAGDIVAVAGLKTATTGDTLCDAGQADRAGADGIPRAGHRDGDRAEVQGRSGEDGRGARASSPRTRSFRVTTDQETGQTIIKGMGELHLEIIVDIA